VASAIRECSHVLREILLLLIVVGAYYSFLDDRMHDRVVPKSTSLLQAFPKMRSRRTELVTWRKAVCWAAANSATKSRGRNNTQDLGSSLIKVIK
jgi:hypothetical protein